MHPGIIMVEWRTRKTNGKNIRFPLDSHHRAHIEKAVPYVDDSAEERPFSTSGSGMKVGGYDVSWSSRLETVGVDNDGETLFWAQGEEAKPYLDIIEREGPGALLSELDSAGVLKFKNAKNRGR